MRIWLMASLAEWLLYIALISAIFSLFRSAGQFFAFSISTILPSIAFTLLLYLFAISDLSVKNVFFNSSPQLPWFYRMSASWSSHEGSLLLLISMIGLLNWGCFSLIFPLNLQGIRTKEAACFQSHFATINLLLLSCVILTSNPFERFSFTPKDGLGLNPMLQDQAMLIHPPILFLGYTILSAIFFSTIIASYFKNKRHAIFSLNQRLLNLSMFLMTIGIGLGSWWAYRELGWGGFWFFDPVENVSLLPWICGIILHHLLLIYQNDNHKSITPILTYSFLPFLMVLYGTFIVRSGIITSVHSFAFSPLKGGFILAICIATTIIAAISLTKSKSAGPERKFYIIDHLINIGNILWLVLLLIIIISLIYPIYCYFVDNVDVSIDINYFYQIFIPATIPLLLLAAISPGIRVKYFAQLSWSNIKKPVIELITIIIISFSISSYFDQKLQFNLISFVAFLFAVMLCIRMIRLAIHNSSQKQPSKSLILSHFGFGLLAIAISLNEAASETIIFKGKIGDQISSGQRHVTLENIKLSDRSHYYSQIAVFKIDDGDNVVILKPENRLYKVENRLSQEADIFSYLWHDIYAVITHVKDEIAQAQIQFHPMMSILWFSVFLIAFGFLV